MSSLHQLQALIRQLRGPNGCPWDQKQKTTNMCKPLLEECHEVIEAIQDKDPILLREELGDLLFVVLLTCDTAHRDFGLSLEEICSDICTKMIRRHPHVFSSNTQKSSQSWDELKQQEKQRTSILDGIPKTLPALSYAEKQANRVSKVGFDWPDATGVIEKIEEELSELKEAIESKDKEEMEHELGDLLMSCANLGRKLQIPPELALKKATTRFQRRFQWMETHKNKSLSLLSSDELEELWSQAKANQ
jgi:tetrapyrrole methylase family protein/MazG family protein